MKKLLNCFVMMVALSACGNTYPYETKAGVGIEVDGYPFKVFKFKNSNSYAAKLDDFWCKNGCVFAPADYPKAIKAVEKVSGCNVDRYTFQVVNVVGPLPTMSVDC